SAIIGFAIGAYFQRPDSPSGGALWGMLAALGIFTCARLWLAGKAKSCLGSTPRNSFLGRCFSSDQCLFICHHSSTLSDADPQRTGCFCCIVAARRYP